MSSTDFVYKLHDPVGWLTESLSNFIEYGYDPDTCTVRIGKRGNRFCNYKIEEASFQISSPIEATVTPGHTFNGRHHGEMIWLDGKDRHDENWSELITFHDLRTVFIDLTSGLLN